jgi:hypothetical protein
MMTVSSHEVFVDTAAFAIVNVAASAADVAVVGRAGNDFAATLVAATVDILAHLTANAVVVYFLVSLLRNDLTRNQM